MTKQNVANLFKHARSAIANRSPEILTGLGIAGMITTTILAVKATPKALLLIEEKKRAEDVEQLTHAEVVKTTWKCYIPAAISCATSAACLIGANSVHAKRNAALATAYKLSETALIEYKDKVIETIGEKKEQAIREAIDKDHIDKNPVDSSKIFITGIGTTRCYDYISGRYFESDIEKIKKVVNELNRQMLISDYVSLNDFYDELGLTRIPLGNELGWRVDKGLIEPSFSSHLDSDGVPCVVLNYVVAPKRGYSSFY